MANLKPVIGNLTLKRFIKRLLQILAARFGRHTRKPGQAELLILMYHRILPADDPRAQSEEPGMIVTPETFSLHMSLIKPLFKTMHLSRWLELKNNGATLPERTCVITFDDGWADNYEFAYPILKQMDIPATIFLVSDMVDTGNNFWPERLAGLITAIARQPESWADNSLNWITGLTVSYSFDKNNSIAPTQEQLSEIIAATKSLSDDEIHRRLNHIEAQLQLSITQHESALLSWQQVETMQRSGLVEFGSHTCNHIRLSQDKPQDVLQHEIIDSKQAIEDKTGQPVKTFCYPNGDYSTAAEELIKQYYNGAVTTQSGWNTAASNPHLLRRIGLHEDISNDKTSFLARISGWL